MDSNEQIIIKFDWKAIVVGVILAVVLGYTLIYLIPYGNVVSLIVATAVAGYIARGHVMNGAIHGGLVGAIEGLIGLIWVLYVNGMDNNILMILLIVLIGDISVGIIAGTIGNLIRMFADRKASPAE